MKHNVYTYQISTHYLSALINGDYSSLDDREVDNVVAFDIQVSELAQFVDGHKSHHWSVPDNIEPFISCCEISDLISEVVEIELVVMIEEN